MSQHLTAVVWDFDGTLVDTRQKNLNVTRHLVELVRGVPADQCEALRSLADYEQALQRHGHWTEFYRVELGMSDSEVDHAGGLWGSVQVQEPTLPESYEGISEVLEAFSGVPHGIVSLNSRDNVLRLIGALGLAQYFNDVIGYEAYPPDRHKPEPDALIACIDRLTRLAPGTVMYIGDHEIDAACAHNANRYLHRQGVAIDVLGVGAAFGPHADHSAWKIRPDFRAETPAQIIEFAEGLGLVGS